MMPNIEQLGTFWNVATFDITNAQFYFIENGDDVISKAFELRLFKGFFIDINSDQNVGWVLYHSNTFASNDRTTLRSLLLKLLKI